ncbi:Tetratricopeptide repeat-containing protein [bacterium JGI 053]|nr:Tetratricopeptide repeat-containing protein [bacterium JGI 053]
MAIEGPLRELALSDVFQLLDLSRKTGVLTITHESRHRPAVVRFDRGAVTGAELGEVQERIGHLLLRAGKLTERHVEQARRAQESSPGRPLGEILVEAGYVSADDVRRQLRFQIEEAIYALIQWKDGYFRFEESAAAHGGGGVSVRVPTESLLMEAARRVDEWSTLEPKVPHMGVIPALVQDSAESPTLDLHPSEWEVLAEIDGVRTLKEIATGLGRSEFTVAKIVYGLVTTGVVEILEERAEEAAAPMERPLRDALGEAKLAISDGHADRARRILDDLSRGHPDRPEVWLALAQAQRRLGRWSDAVVALARASALDPLSALTHYYLGFASAHTGDFHRAREAWATYLRLEDGDAARRLNAADAMDAADRLLSVMDREAE